MVNCCAFGCKSRSERKEPGISFHSFPKDLERRKSWISNINIKNWEPSASDRVCSKHFEQKWFYQADTRTRLLNQAVPTIFSELPKYLQPLVTPKRKRAVTPDPGPSTTPSTIVTSPETPRKKMLKRKLFEKSKNREKTRKIRAPR